MIREQLVDTPEVSDRQIAVGLGVSHPTVSKAREDMESKGELVKVTTSIGADGKEYPRKPVSVFNPTAREMQDDVTEYALYTTRQIGVISAGIASAQGKRNDLELRPRSGQSKTETRADAGISRQRRKAQGRRTIKNRCQATQMRREKNERSRKAPRRRQKTISS